MTKRFIGLLTFIEFLSLLIETVYQYIYSIAKMGYDFETTFLAVTIIFVSLCVIRTSTQLIRGQI